MRASSASASELRRLRIARAPRRDALVTLLAGSALCAGAAASAPARSSVAGSGRRPAAGVEARRAPALGRALPWQPHVRAAIAYARTRAGTVSFAVRTERRQWGWRVTRTVPSASVLKAMLLVAYLDDRRVRGRPLRASDRRLIDPMIERSDNTAATQVLAFVGPAEVNAVARDAGMRRFTLDPVVWGLSRIDAADQARFFLHIDSYVVARHRAAAMHLLASVVASQRWGIGRLRAARLAGLLQGRLGLGHGRSRASGRAAAPWLRARVCGRADHGQPESRLRQAHAAGRVRGSATRRRPSDRGACAGGQRGRRFSSGQQRASAPACA